MPRHMTRGHGKLRLRWDGRGCVLTSAVYARLAPGPSVGTSIVQSSPCLHANGLLQERSMLRQRQSDTQRVVDSVKHCMPFRLPGSGPSSKSGHLTAPHHPRRLLAFPQLLNSAVESHNMLVSALTHNVPGGGGMGGPGGGAAAGAATPGPLFQDVSAAAALVLVVCRHVIGTASLRAAKTTLILLCSRRSSLPDEAIRLSFSRTWCPRGPFGSGRRS